MGMALDVDQEIFHVKLSAWEVDVLIVLSNEPLHKIDSVRLREVICRKLEDLGEAPRNCGDMVRYGVKQLKRKGFVRLTRAGRGGRFEVHLTRSGKMFLLRLAGLLGT